MGEEQAGDDVAGAVDLDRLLRRAQACERALLGNEHVDGIVRRVVEA
jgi:hypothetical protein